VIRRSGSDLTWVVDRMSAPGRGRYTGSGGRQRSGRCPVCAPTDGAAREAVAVAAYYRAERRGFAPGGALGDWLAAERELRREHG